jgi:hypothetical protein
MHIHNHLLLHLRIIQQSTFRHYLASLTREITDTSAVLSGMAPQTPDNLLPKVLLPFVNIL